jgi:hypothetical protein
MPPVFFPFFPIYLETLVKQFGQTSRIWLSLFRKRPQSLGIDSELITTTLYRPEVSESKRRWNGLTLGMGLDGADAELFEDGLDGEPAGGGRDVFVITFHGGEDSFLAGFDPANCLLSLGATPLSLLPAPPGAGWGLLFLRTEARFAQPRWRGQPRCWRGEPRSRAMTHAAGHATFVRVVKLHAGWTVHSAGGDPTPMRVRVAPDPTFRARGDAATTTVRVAPDPPRIPRVRGC